MFWNRREKNLVAVTHVTAHRDQKKLTVRLAFADRKPLEVIVSADVIQRLATMFGSLATTIHDSQSGRHEVAQPSREFCERLQSLSSSPRRFPTSFGSNRVHDVRETRDLFGDKISRTNMRALWSIDADRHHYPASNKIRAAKSDFVSMPAMRTHTR
jgi:hypothetical protein